MVNENTFFFKYVDNFAKIANIPSFPIFKGENAETSNVTIFIPTYKRSFLLKEAIDSALNQVKYNEYDIIVVDNDPERDDETEILMLSYDNPKLSYYKNEENLGMFGNWNRGFELANGEWVIMLHDDDLLVPTFLSESMSVIDRLNGDIGCLACRKNVFYSKVKNVNAEDCAFTKGVHEIYPFDNHIGFALGAPTGAVFKKESVCKLGGFNPEYFPTSDFCFLVYFNLHYKCYYNSSSLLLYRIEDNESLNPLTQQKFIIFDYYLLINLMKLYSIPLFLFRPFFYYCSLLRANSNVLNMDLSLDFLYSDLKLKKYSNFLILISRFFFRVCRFFVRKKHINVHKVTFPVN